MEAEKEAQAACIEARKLLASKQKEAKGADAQSAIAKLQGRLTAGQQDVVKAKKAAAGGDKLIKGKEVIVQEDERMQQIEAEVEKAEASSNPREDLGEERLSSEKVVEMVA